MAPLQDVRPTFTPTPTPAPAPAPTLTPGPAPAVAATRLFWRAVVRTDKRQEAGPSVDRIAWHAAGCVNSADVQAHCAEGQRHLLANEDPDGHCLTDGVCWRCPQG